MRIEGEAPKQQSHSFSRCRNHGGRRATATSDRFLPFRRYAREVPKLRISSSFLLPITPLNAA